MKAHVILGIIGGILGLLMTPLNFILSIVIFVFTGGQGPQLLYLTLAGVLCSIAGIVGAALSRNRFRLGGITMLASGVTPVLITVIIALTFNVPGIVPPLLALYFWTFILMGSGIISITKKTGSTPALPQAPS